MNLGIFPYFQAHHLSVNQVHLSNGW